MHPGEKKSEVGERSNPPDECDARYQVSVTNLHSPTTVTTSIKGGDRQGLRWVKAPVAFVVT